MVKIHLLQKVLKNGLVSEKNTLFFPLFSRNCDIILRSYFLRMMNFNKNLIKSVQFRENWPKIRNIQNITMQMC